jgi:hypothetical protein
MDPLPLPLSPSPPPPPPQAITAGVPPSAICPASEGAGTCLSNILEWGLVPFIPGAWRSRGDGAAANPAYGG